VKWFVKAKSGGGKRLTIAEYRTQRHIATAPAREQRVARLKIDLHQGANGDTVLLLFRMDRIFALFDFP
jgi:hypothetical protein